MTVARLVETRGGPCWRYRPKARLGLDEANLDSADENAILLHAGRLLAESHDPAEGDPVRFHLLHRPNGRDVLLLQYAYFGAIDIGTRFFGAPSTTSKCRPLLVPDGHHVVSQPVPRLPPFPGHLRP